MANVNNIHQKGGVEPVLMSSAIYIGHVLVSLIHHNQITGHDILDIYEEVDNNLARSEIAYTIENELRNNNSIKIKEFVKRYKSELKKIKNNKEISSIKKDLKEPLTQLLENGQLENNLLQHNYKKNVVLTEEDEDLYAKSIFSERLLDKISLNIDEIIEIVENVKKNELDATQKHVLKMIQNFVYLYKHFKDNRSHFEYDKDGNRVFIVEGNLKTKSLSKPEYGVTSGIKPTTAKKRKFKFKTLKKHAAKYTKTIRKIKSLSIDKKQTKIHTPLINSTLALSA